MSIQIIAPCFYPSGHYVRYFTQSATRHKLDLHLYGATKPFKDWIETHIVECLDVLKHHVDSTHVLFTDASDVMFLSSMRDIQFAYDFLGRPPVLFSYERSGLNAGGWIGERTAMIDVLELLKTCGTSGDPQVRLREAVARGWLNVAADLHSALFQVVDGSELEFEHGKLRNVHTGTFPCLLHFAGGYTDPENGKAQQIEPVWKALGYGL